MLDFNQNLNTPIRIKFVPAYSYYYLCGICISHESLYIDKKVSMVKHFHLHNYVLYRTLLMIDYPVSQSNTHNHMHVHITNIDSQAVKHGWVFDVCHQKKWLIYLLLDWWWCSKCRDSLNGAIHKLNLWGAGFSTSLCIKTCRENPSPQSFSVQWLLSNNHHEAVTWFIHKTRNLTTSDPIGWVLWYQTIPEIHYNIHTSSYQNECFSW